MEKEFFELQTPRGQVIDTVINYFPAPAKVADENGKLQAVYKQNENAGPGYDVEVLSYHKIDSVELTVPIYDGQGSIIHYQKVWLKAAELIKLSDILRGMLNARFYVPEEY